jgi:hypothetical protein
MRLVRFALLSLLVVVPLLAHSGSDSSGDSYVLRLDSLTYMNGRGMSGEALKRLQSTHGKRFFWFRRAEHTYLVTNADALDRAEAIIAPQAELGQKQGALGQKQAALGSQQARLGGQQGQLGIQQAGTGSETKQLELARQQEILAEKQNELGKVQEDLGREQEKLGQMQERLSIQIEKQLGALVDQWIRTGEAKEIAR